VLEEDTSMNRSHLPSFDAALRRQDPASVVRSDGSPIPRRRAVSALIALPAGVAAFPASALEPSAGRRTRRGGDRISLRQGWLLDPDDA
jgi:hypothetical protein